MNYPVFEQPPPIPQLNDTNRIERFRQVPIDDIKRYFKWFLAQIPVRINILASAVNAENKNECWRPDFSRESLGPLGQWIGNSVGFRKRTPREILDIELSINFTGPVDDEALTDDSRAIATDVGIYLGEVLTHQNPGVNWIGWKRPQKSIDYGRPVLTGFEFGKVNPIRYAGVAVNRIALGESGSERLLGVYDHLVEAVATSTDGRFQPAGHRRRPA